MRQLTIKREKSFVGCLMKMKVYVEDASAPELEINGVPCRKLGDIKNGEEKTFEIGNNAMKVFVIADKLSKGYCNEFVNIPEGEEDVSLSGRPRFNLLNGNAFRFDGVTDEEVLQNRKEATKKGEPIIIFSVIIGFIVGFALVSLM